MSRTMEEEIHLRDLEDCKARDRMQEKISIYALLLLFIVYTTQNIATSIAGGFLVILVAFAVIRNKQYQDLEKEIKNKIREECD